MGRDLPEGMIKGKPISALAPMQDVTNLPFMQVVGGFGAPDYFFTEYLRVHEHSRLEPSILDCVLKNPTDRPVFIQLIGEDIPHMIRTVKGLQSYPLAGIDLNMGCPAPKVYKKNVGGGLLRDIDKVDQLLGALRESIDGLFTVKMRTGFDHTENFGRFLELINKHEVNLLSVHGRTVKELYRGGVNYDLIKQAVETVKCPVLANGNIDSVEKAQWVLNYTGAHGVMIGRSCIRNPWIFRQLREYFSGKDYYRPKLRDVFDYIKKLHTATSMGESFEKRHVNYLKKYLNFVGQGVDPEGVFLKSMRRVQSAEELFSLCKTLLLDNGNADKYFAEQPYEGLVARPNCEDGCRL